MQSGVMMEPEVVGETPEEKEMRILKIIQSQREQRLKPKEAARLLAENERLRFGCDECKNEWVKTKPEGYVVRSGDGTNFFVLTEDEDGMRSYIYCPQCGGHKRIQLLPPKKKQSSRPQLAKKPHHQEIEDTYMEPSE